MAEPILQLKNISKRFGREVVLDGVDLSVYRGETLSIIGVSGTGKTTLLRIIAGLERPDLGEVYLLGRLATQGRRLIIPPHQREIGFIFQNLGLWGHLSALEHLLFVDPSPDKAEAVLIKFGLFEHRDKKPYQLSGGQRQRLAIARALVQEVELLLLDEPFSSLDPIRKKQLRRELSEIQAERGLTLIYVTHDPSDVKLLSERVAVLNGGKIIQCGTYGELVRNPVSPLVRELLE